MAKQRTEAQNQAYNAGKVYARAKAGKRIAVRDENKDSFRAGVKKARAEMKAQSGSKRSKH